jgi:RHS repeat-associated protein
VVAVSLFGNGVQAYSEYDQAVGLPFVRQAGVGGGSALVNARLHFDWNGNLLSREDLNQSNLIEAFSYDALDRLDSSTRNGVTNLDVSLDAIGNVTHKSDVGSYSYHPSKPRAVIAAGSHSYGYDANGNMSMREGYAIDYASYNLPTVIRSAEGTSTLSYGAGRELYKQIHVKGSTSETTVYVGGLLERMKKGTKTEYRHQIRAGAAAVAVYVRRSAGTPLQDTYYLHRDQLGSPELITDASGAAVVALSFDAYGQRRDSDWAGPIRARDADALAKVSRRGFTDHAHLDSVGLIHMGGRVYDPRIGRFLSVDPWFDGVGSTQGGRGYAYVHNNPLTYTDPSGYNATPIVRHIDAGGGSLEEIIVTDSRLELFFDFGGFRDTLALDPGGFEGVSTGGESLENVTVIGKRPKPPKAPPLPKIDLGPVRKPQTPSPLGETACPAPMTFARDTAIRRSLSNLDSGGSDKDSGGSSLGRNATNGALIVGGALGAGGAVAGGYYGVIENVGHARHFAATTRIVLGTMSIAEGAAAGAMAGGTLGLAWGMVVGAVAGAAATPIITPASGVFEREDAWLEANCPQSKFRQ